MSEIVGVSFEDGGQIYYFSPSELQLIINTEVIVETEKGLQFGKVVIENVSKNKKDLNLPLKKVIRIATEEDKRKHLRNLNDKEKAMEQCRNLIEKHQLDMKLLDASFTFDRKQLLFHFTADGRIDFRDLAKELAALYKTRIELRQIGVRDKARVVGGLGPCGLKLCCSNFLYEFDAVSINMAKNQNIALNPNKINGVCGRLLCCLTYENDNYTEARVGLPEYGQIVNINEGTGKVISVDILKGSYDVDIPKVGVVKVTKDGNNQ